MLFSKNGGQKSGQLHHDEKSLYPIMHMTGTFKEYQKELARKEVESLSELGMVGSSFAQVLDQADNFQSQLEEFGQSLSGINDSAGRFEQEGRHYPDSVPGPGYGAGTEGHFRACAGILQRHGDYF